ncbi:ComF family protein [Oceanobacter mangrovi]|uniref:ComF family protein n=1 Tax=Oceanobacter mangrovi TaxID=2862510 RepID=UPI001C8E10DD|nr:ComF family protein [Oceanobacter mangrovi]
MIVRLNFANSSRKWLKSLIREQCHCELCLEPLLDSASGFLCDECERQLSQSFSACSQCGEPLMTATLPLPGHTAQRCKRCQQQTPTFDYSICHSLYTGPVCQWVQLAKDKRQQLWMQRLARWMAIRAPAHLNQVDALVAVPSHWHRLFMRGFNPSQILAETLSQRYQIPLLKRALYKSASADQRLLGRLQRQQQISQHYHPGQLDLSGQHLLLIDDVMTTGATASELARLLKQQGATTVGVWVLARTPSRQYQSSHHYWDRQQGEI